MFAPGRGGMATGTSTEARDRAKVTRENMLADRRLATRLAAAGLAISEINWDGNCLFSALSHQLWYAKHPTPLSAEALRQAAVNYISGHQEDFEAFVVDGTHGSFEAYCQRMRGTATWGGDTEIRALSLFLERDIHVEHPAMDTHKYPGGARGPHEDKPLRLVFHRTGYGGNHYSSVISVQQQQDERLARLRRREVRTLQGGRRTYVYICIHIYTYMCMRA